MAIRFSLYSLPILPSPRGQTTSRLLMMSVNNHISVNLQIRSSADHKIKVFEDQSTGIVCYKDENGEITCEGYDEGPRFRQPFLSCSNNSRRGDEEIVELLQRCLLHVTEDGDELNDADVGINCNGSNKQC